MALSQHPKAILDERDRMRNRTAFADRKYYKRMKYRNITFSIGDDIKVCVEHEKDRWGFEVVRISDIYQNDNDEVNIIAHWYLDLTSPIANHPKNASLYDLDIYNRSQIPMDRILVYLLSEQPLESSINCIDGMIYFVSV